MNSNQKPIKIHGINISPLIQAHKTLIEALPQAKSLLERDGIIHRFEYTFELTWKTLKKLLFFKGIVANSPRDIFREAAKIGLIKDPNLWFRFLENRNNTSHVYHDQMAEEISEDIPLFSAELTKLIEEIKNI